MASHSNTLSRLAGAALLLAAAASPALAQGNAESIEATRTGIEKWVETRQLITREKREWQSAKEMIADRALLLRREAETLRTRIAEATESIAEADSKRAALVAENEQRRANSDRLVEVVGRLELRAVALVARLPEVLVDKVRPLSQRIPAKPEDSRLSLSERFQNVVGVLNELNKFQREITVVSEVRTLPDGTTAEVSAVYLGIGQAWYSSADGKVAGVGSAGAEGWTWQPANDAAPAIRAAIAILKNEQVAAFVGLPVQVR
ncbi:MAG: hypothetical protein RIT25_2724 [Planctomycetota bacterium]|jgi:hypothetical protein